MDMCERGQRISADCKDLVTDGDCEPTKLYWHLAQCDECADAREKRDPSWSSTGESHTRSI